MNSILIVDDIETKLNELKFTLKFFAKECDIVTASSSNQAINEIRKLNFDLVVTDMAMEEHNSGLNVLKAAKEKNINTKVIIVTDYESPLIEIEAKKIGVFDFLKRGSNSFIRDFGHNINIAFQL
jgi:DNA-binding NtrC family response regulator